ncbi:glycosyltransferase [Orrella sp. JC864]|uniref:glycosyltransferase n=1 Tax=Orrella sp. JC864 TaxID=3120298 RepID=UPI00300B9690
MSTILLCNNTLLNFAGSELLTLELAQHLRTQNHDVTVASFAYQGRLTEAFEAAGVRWLDLSDNSVRKHPDFDLLWGHHWSCFDALLLNKGINASRIIYSSLSPYEPLECPPLYTGRFSLHLANSYETRDKLKEYDISSDSIVVMPNCVTSEWADHPPAKVREQIKSVAIVSNHIPAEISTLAAALARRGIQVNIYGISHAHQKVTPALLAQNDVVITIGRTVQMALSISVPVYCYDRFGGPGYITLENFDQAAYFNFSGRCCNRKASASEIASELLANYDLARHQVPELALRIRKDFFLPAWVSAILQKVEATPKLSTSAIGKLKQAKRLQSTATRSDKSPISDWLHARKPTSRQNRLIQETLGTKNGSPLISVIVVDRRNRPEAVEKTLKSLLPVNCGYSNVQPHVVSQMPSNPSMLSISPAKTCWHSATPDAIAGTINRIAAQSNSDWILSIDAGDEFTPFGLVALAQELANADGIRAAYADEMMRLPSGDLSALLRPDFNLDLLLSMPAGMARRWLFRRDVFIEAGGFDPAFADAPEFDLLLRLIDAGGVAGLGHVDEPLLIIDTPTITTTQAEQIALLRHLRNRGYEQAKVAAHLPGCYRINYGHPATPAVSIIIPTRNQFQLLLRCVETLLEKTAYKNYEVLIVDNGSTDADACAWLDGIESMNSPQLRVLRYPQPFNYSAMNNLAARHARGEYLVLLNNDTAMLREDWLDAMLNHAQRPEVGIVGAKLLYPDGRVQHAGVVLGLRGPADHPFIGESADAPGYMYRLQVDQNYSAVTAACLMIRASVYAEIGGLDEDAFKVSYNDVDLCLKARQAGYLVVWTPHAVVMHVGSVSQAKVDTTDGQAKMKRFQAEQDALYEKWLPVIARDPAYNQNLTLEGAGFQVDIHNENNWRPLRWRPLPVILAQPADRQGCGHYRIMQPSRTINDFGLADSRTSDRYYSPVEMERLAPDTLVLQRQLVKEQIELQKRLARFNRCFKVAELDDYLPNLPLKSAHQGQLPKDILKTMREALKLVDRFIVSTPALAEALDGLHPDTRVVENHLPLHWWSNVQGQRRQGLRPRVGWAGGSSHRGDLELIAEVVKALSDEVEWVFFGMCPDSIRPYIHEFHPGVPIEEYPAKLAGLNLDLALAPLEDNLFNRCKSNLRLLEYGACGFPVVCSDIMPYRGPLPVTRVKPRFKDWVEAIRMHTHDLDATAKAGDALRQAVLQNWMLDQKHAAYWLSQWLA